MKKLIIAAMLFAMTGCAHIDNGIRWTLHQGDALNARILDDLTK